MLLSGRSVGPSAFQPAHSTALLLIAGLPKGCVEASLKIARRWLPLGSTMAGGSSSEGPQEEGQRRREEKTRAREEGDAAPLPRANVVDAMDAAASSCPCAVVRALVDRFLYMFRLYVFPDVRMHRWTHFRPFFKTARPTYGVQMWYTQLAALASDLGLFPRGASMWPSGTSKQEGHKWASQKQSLHSAVYRQHAKLCVTTVTLVSLRKLSRFYVAGQALLPSRVLMTQYRLDVMYVVLAATTFWNRYICNPFDEWHVETIAMRSVCAQLLAALALTAGPAVTTKIHMLS